MQYGQYGIWISCLLLFSGCASVLAPKMQELKIDTSVDGAMVYFNNQKMGKTPIDIRVPKTRGSIIEIKKKGYNDEVIRLRMELAPQFFLNALSTGTSTLGAATDFSTGSALEYRPYKYYIELKRVSKSSKSAKDQTTPQNGNPLERKDSSIRKSNSVVVTRFVLANFDKLQQQVAQGEGEYLRTLLWLQQIDSARTLAYIKQLQKFHSKTNDPMIFAQYVKSLTI